VVGDEEAVEDVLPPQDEDVQVEEAPDAPDSPHGQQEVEADEYVNLEEDVAKEVEEAEEDEEPNDLDHLLEDVPDITEDAL
jgi:hypothetical protein